MDSNEQAFRGLVDAIVAHPSTKPHIPTSTREVQLEAELRFVRNEVNRALAVIQTALDRLDVLTEPTVLDDSAESPF